MNAKKWSLIVVPLLAVVGYWIATAQPRHDFFEFKNTSRIAIWVEDAQGFDGLPPCGFLAPGASASLAFVDARLPKKTAIQWRKEEERSTGPFRTYEIDLTSLKRSHASDTLVF